MALLATLGWTAVLAGVVHLRWDGDPRALLSLGANFPRPETFTGIPRVGPWGYDGQFYAVLATDPLLRREETIRSLDTPGYRALRIGVPLLAWLLALGHAGTAVVIYQLLCWSLTLAGVALMGRWLRDSGHSPWWALLLAAHPGVMTSLLRSTVDGAAVTMVLTALLLHRNGRTRWSLAALVAAALVRETSLLAAAAVAVVEARRGRWGLATLALGLPSSVLLVWRGMLLWRLGGDLASGTANFGVPLVWLPEKVATVAGLTRPWTAPEAWGLAGLLLLLTGVAAWVVDRRPWRSAELTLAASGALALGLSSLVYVEVYAYSRVLLLLPALALPIALDDTRAWRRRLVLAGLGAWAVSGGLAVRGELKDALHPPSPMLRQDTVQLAKRPQPAPRTVLLAPVAHTPGRGGALWRTDLVLYNPLPTPLELRIEYLGRGGRSHNPRPVTVTLAGRELRTVDDAVHNLFGASGGGAFRMMGPQGLWLLRASTRDASRGMMPEPLTPLTPEDLVTAEHPALLRGLPSGPGSARINLGVINPGPDPITVECELSPTTPIRRGWQLTVPGESARQLDDLLADSPPSPDGTAELSIRISTPDGRALVYASLVGPQPGLVRNLYPVPSTGGLRRP